MFARLIDDPVPKWHDARMRHGSEERRKSMRDTLIK